MILKGPLLAPKIEERGTLKCISSMPCRVPAYGYAKNIGKSLGMPGEGKAPLRVKVKKQNQKNFQNNISSIMTSFQ